MSAAKPPAHHGGSERGCKLPDLRVKDRKRYVHGLLLAFGTLSVLCVYTGAQLGRNVYVTMDTRRDVTHQNTPEQHLAKSWATARCNGCFRLDYRRLLTPGRVCSGGSGITMVIVITTAPGNAAARAGIRNTWARFSLNNTGSVRYVFLLGLASGDQQTLIEKESGRHGDILQDGYADTYDHLTVKVLMGLRWVLHNCPAAKYVMRAADDTYVNVPGVVHLVQQHDEMFTNKMFGHCLGWTRPFRQIGHKWYVSHQTYPYNLYPPYCIGTTFMMKLDLARRLVETSKDVPYFKLEDVYFGLVLNEMRVSTLQVNGFDLQYPRLQRHPAEQWYTLHKVSQWAMSFIWTREKQRLLVYKDFYRLTGPHIWT